MTIVMRPTCWHQNFVPNGLSAPAQGLCLNVFSSITADFNISSAIRWAIQGQWSSGWVTERTRPYRKIYDFQFQRAITPKMRNPELRFLHSARRLMLPYTCVKFHENISNGFLVTQRTRFCDRQTDGQTDRRPGQKEYVSQPYGGRHNYWKTIFCLKIL